MAKFKWTSKADQDAEALEVQRKMVEEEELKAELAKAPSKISSLEDENMMLMMASAETYEQMYNENMNLMLAVAEMYEMMVGGIE